MKTQSGSSNTSSYGCHVLTKRVVARSTVASSLQADVTKYKDNIALFRHAEATFGGVDVNE